MWRPDFKKCKQCRLEFLISEGTYKNVHMKNRIVQNSFFCFKCWDESDNGKNIEDQISGNSKEAKYKKNMMEMIEVEWDDERKTIEERLKNWSLNRLISKGYCRTGMIGKRLGKFFDKKRIVFTSTSIENNSSSEYSQIQFSNGDEVTVCRDNPLTEASVFRGEVENVQENGSKIKVCTKEVPPDLTIGTWRIDVGANKIAFERQMAAINFLCKIKNKDNVCNAVKTDIINSYVELSEENDGKLNGTNSHKENQKEYSDINNLVDMTDYILTLNNPVEENIPKSMQILASKGIQNKYGLLNESQKKAVKSVLLSLDHSNERNFISIIQGPPGTGKTTTIANLIAQIVEMKRSNHTEQKYQILVCADSNVAVDELLKRLVYNHTGPPTNLKVIRLGSCLKIDEELHKYSLPYQLDNHVNMKKVSFYRDSLDTVKDDLKNLGLLTGKDKDSAHRKQFDLMSKIRGLQNQMTQEILDKADVICSTLVGCGSDALLDRIFQVIVQDEATQATEPRSLIAIQRLEPCKLSKIILVGDQNQLPPTVISKKAEDKGLKISLFDRIIKQQNQNINFNMLEVQYRMNPILRAFPSKEFYSNKLLDGINCNSVSNFMSSRFNFQQSPVIYIDTSGIGSLYNENSDDILKPLNENDRKEKQYSDSGSKYNKYEVDLIKHIVLNHIQENQKTSNPFEIGIITPYSAQVKELKKSLWKPYEGKFHRNCEIKTVDGFQGREKDLILFSCVRTEQIGFLNDYRRLNVAITRARKGLLVIGNSALLKNDPVWLRYLSFIRRYNMQ